MLVSLIVVLGFVEIDWEILIRVVEDGRVVQVLRLYGIMRMSCLELIVFILPLLMIMLSPFVMLIEMFVTHWLFSCNNFNFSLVPRCSLGPLAITVVHVRHRRMPNFLMLLIVRIGLRMSH